MSDFLSVLKERTDNPFFQEKKNPFGGTFLLMWALYNWKFLFTIFNFDDGLSLSCKIQKLQQIIDSTGITYMFLTPLMWALLSLLIFYISSSLSLFILNGYNSIAKPHISQLVSGKSSIVTKAEHEDLKTSYKNLDEDYSKTLKRLAEKEAEMSQKLTQNELAIKERKENIDKIYKDIFTLINTKTILVSDEKTRFVQSKNGQGIKNTKATVILEREEDWNYNLLKHQDKLSGAFWIADRYLITDQEAIDGGEYDFESDFYIYTNKSLISSIKFYCLVDDFLKLRLNDELLKNTDGQSESSGFNSLITYDLTKNYGIGINRIGFTIRNSNNPNLNQPQFESPPNPKKRGWRNPYGIVFSVVMELKDPTNFTNDDLTNYISINSDKM